jgi:hypothetical protein
LRLTSKLISDNEQDKSAIREWWNTAKNEDKLLVWEYIQREYNDPVMEVMSRFAQLAFAEMVKKELISKELKNDSL